MNNLAIELNINNSALVLLGFIMALNFMAELMTLFKAFMLPLDSKTPVITAVALIRPLVTLLTIAVAALIIIFRINYALIVACMLLLFMELIIAIKRYYDKRLFYS